MAKGARLKDIAEALNISITTVSRALNDKEDISDKTKGAVKEVAKLLNYRPNYFAKYLTEESNNIIGVIVPYIDHDYFSSIVKGIATIAQEKGYFLLVAESLDDNENESIIIDKFLDFNAKGILIAPVFQSSILRPDQTSKIKKQKIVLIDRFSHEGLYSEVTNDHYQGARLAVTHLIDQGYRRIAHVQGLIGDRIAEAIYQGYIDVLKEHDLHEPFTHQNDNVCPALGEDACEKFFTSEFVPDAIFAVSDEASLGVYRYCYKHNISIPHELGVIGYSNAGFSKYLSPALSTIEQHSFDMGVTSAQILIKERQSPQRVIFNSTLVVRESTIRHG